MADPITPTTNSEAAAPGSETPPAYADFDTFLAAQPDEVKALYTAKTAGLSSALDKERDKAKTASAQLRELAKTADPETADKLRKAADEKDAENKALKTQLEFQTAAAASRCEMIEDAWKVNQALGLSIKQMQDHPVYKHFFAQPAGPPRTNAGNGVGPQPAAEGNQTINDRIRQATGRL